MLEKVLTAPSEERFRRLKSSRLAFWWAFWDTSGQVVQADRVELTGSLLVLMELGRLGCGAHGHAEGKSSQTGGLPMNVRTQLVQEKTLAPSVDCRTNHPGPSVVRKKH